MRNPSSMNWFRAVVQPRVGHGEITASMCPPSRTRHRAWQIRAALASRRKVRLYPKPLDQAAVRSRKTVAKQESAIRGLFLRPRFEKIVQSLAPKLRREFFGQIRTRELPESAQ